MLTSDLSVHEPTLVHVIIGNQGFYEQAGLN